MGESKTNRTARLSAAVTAGLAAVALLASCSAGAAPGASAPTGPAAASASASASASAAPSESAEPVVVVTPTTEPVAPTRAEVVPFVTSAVWDAEAGLLDVSAIVPEVVETGGTCTVTVTVGDASATKEGKAAPAASYTGCPQLAVDAAELPSGTWQVQVSYASDESAGESAVTTVTTG